MALEFSFSDISKFFDNTKKDENSFFDDTTKKITNSIEERKNEFIDFTNELKNNAKELIDTTADKKFEQIHETTAQTAKEISSLIENTIDKLMEKTGAVVSKVGTKISEVAIDVKEWILDVENWKKVGATVVNEVMALVKGLVFLVESLVDGLMLLNVLQLLPVTLCTGLYDIIKGIATGEFNWTATKGLWTNYKNIVTYGWTDKLFDKFYETKAGKVLDNYAYTPFKSDGVGCKVTEGIGYVAGIILISLATAGIGGGASVAGGTAGSVSSLMPTLSATFSGIAGLGKYTAEEWNKNDVTIDYNGQQQKLEIDYQKYLEITELGEGKSTTIEQQVKLEDGSISKITFKITKNGKEYNIVDNKGTQVEFKGLNESSTVKGYTVGVIKGLWESFQYWIGGKIGTGSFSKITEHITSPIAKEAAKSTIRVGLDTLTGVVEVPFQTLMAAFSEDMTLKEAFEASGGWEAIKSQALIASISSFGGEAFSFKGNLFDTSIKTAIELDDSSALEQIFKNAKPKQLNKMLDALDDSQFNKLIDNGTLKNVDSVATSSLVKSLEGKKLTKYLDSLLDSEVKELANEKRVQQLVKTIENSSNPREIIKKIDSFELKNVIDNLSENNKAIAKNILLIDSLSSSNSSKWMDIIFDKKILTDYQDELLAKIIKDQDDVFAIKDSGLKSTIADKIKEITKKNPNFYKSLSDENLVRFFANDTSNINCLKEIEFRIDCEKSLFSRSSFNFNFFGKKTSDSQTAFSNLSEVYQLQARELSLEDWKNVLPSLKQLDYGNNGFFNQALLGKMFKEGRIDDQGIAIIKELNDTNPNIIKNFNFEMLDSEIVKKLDKKYIMEIGMYDDLSFKITSMSKNNKALFDSFASIINKSKADDSLLTFYPKTKICLNYLFENQNKITENLDSDSFVNYMLYNKSNYLQKNIAKRIEVKFDDNYISNFRNKCDDLFKKADSLEEMKEIYFQKYFSLSRDEVKTFISKYSDDIDSVLKYDENLESSTILNMLKKVEENGDIDYIKRLYDTQEIYLNPEEILRFDNNLKKIYASDYSEKLAITENKINISNKYDYVQFNNKQIKIVEATNDFSLLVHSTGTGFVKDKTAIYEGSYIKDWYQMDNPTTHGLSTSYISSSNIGSCPVNDMGVMYAFTDVAPESIAIMAPYDLNSNIADYGFTANNAQKYLSADNMSNNTLRVYNEFVLDRASVKPNYVIIYDDSPESIINNALKAASDWDIPILKINKTELAENQMSKVNMLFDQFDKSGDIMKLKESVELFESNVSGYKLNSYVKEGNVDATASINNEFARDIFKSERLEKTIKDYVDKVGSKHEINKIIEILENVKKKYDIVNDEGTNLVANTKSYISIDGLIEYAQRRIGVIV